MNFYLIYIVLLSLLIGCASPKNEVTSDQPPPFKPNFYIVDKKDSVQIIANFNDIGNSKNKLDFINSINSLSVNFKSSSKKLLRNIMLPKTVMKQTSVDGKMITSILAQGYFSPNIKSKIEPASVELIIQCKGQVFSFEKPFKDLIRTYYSDNKNNMTLLPIIEKLDSINYFIGLSALRKSLPPKEYLPSSEDFRAEIFNQKSVLVWSSNFNKNFLQAKQPVKPLNIGDYYIYSIIWNSKNNNGVKANPGDYILKLTIPSQPYPYFVTFNFQNE